MINKLYLHIGQHKTGSTSIQDYLYKNKKKSLFCLNDKGFENKSGNCNHLVKFKGKKNTFKANVNIKSLHQLIKFKNRDSIIISAEHLSWLNDKSEIKKLYDELIKYSKEIIVVVYLRRQDLHACSHKLQGFRPYSIAGRVYDKEKCSLPIQLNNSINNYLNYYDRLIKWADVFGENNILILPFNKNKMFKGDVVEDFLKNIGMENKYQSKDVVTKNYKNISLNKNQISFLSILYKIPCSMVLIKLLYPLILKVTGPKVVIDDCEQQLDFIDAFTGQNVKLIKKFQLNIDFFSEK